MTREEELRNQYIYEKSLLEQWGYQSVTTFEEWLEIKGIQVDHDMVKSGNEHPHTDDISNYPNENHKDRTCKNSVTFKGWVDGPIEVEVTVRLIEDPKKHY